MYGTPEHWDREIQILLADIYNVRLVDISKEDVKEFKRKVKGRELMLIPRPAVLT
jgi:hypothetical protein